MAYKYETKNCKHCEYCVKTDKGLYCSHREGHPKVTGGGWCIDWQEKVKNSVETSKIEYKAYNEGFKDGVDQGIKLSERPQGKWIIVKDEKWGDNVKCPFCGKELAGTDLNFYCKCGADMRGNQE